ncbi:MAG TPA: methyltransferase domain-containing protein [Herpetosiphonaceae bacterium]
MKIFISWSGRRSRQIADAIAPWLKRVFQTAPVEVFVSTVDIRAAARWSEVINAALRESVFGILCLTPENLKAPWLLFESGALSKTAGEGSVCPYLYDLEASDLKPPLEQFNAVKADKAGTRKLVFAINEILGDQKVFQGQLDINFDYLWADLDKELNEIPSVHSDISIGLGHLNQELADTLAEVRDRKWFAENRYFTQVIFDSLQQVKTSLKEAGPYYDVPLTLYPLHLVNLLKTFNPVVKAIAIVDAIEKFWPQKEGEEIRKATNKDSTRVFVFRERDHLKANLAMLLRHASQYNVYALSFNRLAGEYPDYVQDFSIVGGASTPLLAYYAESSSQERGALPLKMIRFSTLASEVSRHEEAISGILKIAILIDKTINVEDDRQVEDLLDKVFTPEFRAFGKRQVEMSSYIEVTEYDEHEEEHAYYSQMMDKMIELINQYRSDTSSVERVLELGAGTGIFTKRLAQLENLDIVAMEIDWACFHLLKKNMARLISDMECRNTKFEPMNKDSRRYNPGGKFKFIVSSFADHHIYFLDKPKYFRNIQSNLEDGGVVIVGDEFLPEHDDKDDNARKRALELYHHHIISIAKAENHPILERLEEGALESGLKGWGDFKVSCEHYERLLKLMGFNIIFKCKIGPTDIDNVGGVYVYAFTK